MTTLLLAKMNLARFLFLASSAFVTTAHGAESKIESSEAAFHLGTAATVCGTISEVKPFAKGVYLNMGPRYPKQHLGLLVWNDDAGKFAAKFGRLSSLQGKRVCASGFLETYKNSIQMKLGDPQALNSPR